MRRWRAHHLRDALVSIHARHCWRAMPHDDPQDNAENQFQSTPAIAGGRCSYMFHVGAPYIGFNPRPPLLAGDASSKT